MDERTREALEASIQHWRENLAAETPGRADISGSACALCREFAEDRGEDVCEDCPVRERTGLINCKGTPYKWASAAFERWLVTELSSARDAFRVAAKAEVEFLESLR